MWYNNNVPKRNKKLKGCDRHRKELMYMTKKTNAQKYQEVIELAKANEPIPDELIEFLQDRKEKAENRNANRKPTKAQLEAEENKEKVYEILCDGKPRTALEVAKEIGYETSQKATSLLGKLLKEERILRKEEKGRAYFYVEV